MCGVLGNVLPVQESKQIAQTRESDQAFVAQGSPRDVAGDENRCAQPGPLRAPVFNDLGTLVLEALLQCSPACLIDRMLIRPRDGVAARRQTTASRPTPRLPIR
jgi:hypothetical protein